MRKIWERLLDDLVKVFKVILWLDGFADINGILFQLVLDLIFGVLQRLRVLFLVALVFLMLFLLPIIYINI